MKIEYYLLDCLRHLASRGVIVFDLVVMKMYSRSRMHRNLHSASSSVGHYRFHRCRFYREVENHLHSLAEVGETPIIDRFQSGHRSDDRQASFANSMMRSRYHHSISEADPGSVDSAGAVVLASLFDVTVADAEPGFAERLVDSPIWLGWYSDIEVEMFQIRKEIRYVDDGTRSAEFRLCQSAR